MMGSVYSLLFTDLNVSHYFFFSCIFSESTTLFRGNSLVSKIVDEMMKLVGKAYLQETLRPIITEVTAYHRSCEIDPKRLNAGENLDINMNNLVNYVQKTFEAIVCSGAKCPTTMCETFFALREATREYFPNMMPVRHQVVSGFIFLRFFVLAIANPRLFQLTSEISVSSLWKYSKYIEFIVYYINHCFDVSLHYAHHTILTWIIKVNMNLENFF